MNANDVAAHLYLECNNAVFISLEIVLHHCAQEMKAHACTATLTNIMHFLAPPPNPNHQNYIPDPQPQPNLNPIHP